MPGALWVPLARQWREYPATADGYRLYPERPVHPRFCWWQLKYRLTEILTFRLTAFHRYGSQYAARTLSQHRHHGPHRCREDDYDRAHPVLHRQVAQNRRSA